MRKIGNYGDQKIQEEQFNVLAKMLTEIKDFRSVKAVLTSILTESERSAISQRLGILRLHKKGFSYNRIEEMLKTTPSTVSKSISNYSNNYDYLEDFDRILSRFRFDPKKFHEPLKIGYPSRGNIAKGGVGARELIRQTEKVSKHK
jgi:uncharacterized protein YerC